MSAADAMEIMPRKTPEQLWVYFVAEILPFIGAVSIATLFFPEESSIGIYGFVFTFNLIFVVDVIRVIDYLLSIGILGLIKRGFRFIHRFFREALLWIYEYCISGIGKTAFWLLVIYLFFMFSYIAWWSVPGLLSATWHFLSSIPGYIKDIGMLAALIRKWLKAIKISSAVTFFKTGLYWQLELARDHPFICLLTILAAAFVLFIGMTIAEWLGRQWLNLRRLWDGNDGAPAVVPQPPNGATIKPAAAEPHQSRTMPLKKFTSGSVKN